MKLEDKRKLEAAITNSFLRDNQKIVKEIVRVFGTLMTNFTDNNLNYNFYLKGGNAFAILEKSNVTGDFDFQLMPPMAEYERWAVFFPWLDSQVVNILQKTVENTAKYVEENPQLNLNFDERWLQVETITDWAQRNAPEINLNNFAMLERRDNIRLIGNNFKNSSYRDIISNEQFKNGRLEPKHMSCEQLKFNELGSKFGPSVYVNYTIPGFILYRLVYAFKYNINGEEVTLKSEIIDVSIPRNGSAEVYMSQEGVITHFRPTGLAEYPFKIPGWGYHFYENINLLQEIKLNISGSPQKEQKRVQRLTRAMQELEVANKKRRRKACLNDLLELEIKEPINGGTAKIQGYYGAMTYNVTQYGNDICFKNIKSEQSRIQSRIKSHFLMACQSWKAQTKYAQIKDYEKLVYFRLTSMYDVTVRTIKQVRDAALVLIKEEGHIDELYFRFISPLMQTNPNAKEEGIYYPLDYIVIDVNERVYDKFRQNIWNVYSSRMKVYDDQFCVVFNELPQKKEVPTKINRTFTLYVKKCNYLPKDRPEIDLTTKFLYRTILESQRYSLAMALENNSPNREELTDIPSVGNEV